MKAQLIKLMDQFGLTATRFADEIGVQRSSISHILSERNRPSYDFILKIINRYPEINSDWLLTGKGEMLKSNIRNNQTLEKNLFNQNEITIPLKSEVGGYASDDHDNPIQEYKNKERKVTNVNFVEKIIVLYNDKTFLEYDPK